MKTFADMTPAEVRAWADDAKRQFDRLVVAEVARMTPDELAAELSCTVAEATRVHTVVVKQLLPAVMIGT